MEINMQKISPMMRSYLELKEQYKDAIIMYRLGDFYEMFFDDAVIASEILDLTLTGRQCGLEERAPMCGIPYHALDSYLPKLIQAGKKVAICEQMNTPEEAGKDLVSREIIRVITPGTVIEENILNEEKNNYLAAVDANDTTCGISWLDVSTGEFNTMEFSYKNAQNIEEALLTIKPAEIIASDFVYRLCSSLQSIDIEKLPPLQRYSSWVFEKDNAKAILLKQFNCVSLDIFEIGNMPLSIGTAGALIDYVKNTQKRDLWHISRINVVKNSDNLIIDSTALRNLELVESLRDGSKKATLFGVLDKTRTSMGARCLRKWIERPSRNSKIINDRLSSVEEFTKNARLRNNLDEALTGIRDLERLATKVVYGNPNPRDLLAIGASLSNLPKVKRALDLAKSDQLVALNNCIDPLEDLCKLLIVSIDEDASTVIREGGFIKDGFNSELDEYRSQSKDGKKWLAEIEAKAKEETDIKTLKVGYNKVFGYYIEVSKGALDKVPDTYIRRQTLTTGERFITEELKELETKLLSAQDNAIRLEQELFAQIVKVTADAVPTILLLTQAIAEIDTLLSFAKVALKNKYVKPTINDSVDKIEIEAGRHPVVEEIIKDSFVPNNTMLDNTLNRMMIITGPNMSGKSTYMRQVALITIMAHMGSFVPAKRAEIAITDRVFTRIGASDDLASGQSTFMVEMLEVATILQNATYKSLLILDEIGRGTSTFDGLAIARAVIEDISQSIKCRTLFSTHYHELTELEALLKGLKNYKVLACEKDKGIIFLHKIMPGGTNKSFGVEVAKLAGLPPEVIKRAKEIQKLLDKISVSTQAKVEKEDDDLLDIAKSNEIKSILKHIDIETLSPIQAFSTLQELVEMAKREN